MVDQYLKLWSREGWYFNDGAGWFTTAENRSRSLGWPWPSTLLSALCTAYGRQVERHRGSPFGKREWEDLREQIALGPQLPLLSTTDGTEQLLWPIPADALAPAQGGAPVPSVPHPARQRFLGGADQQLLPVYPRAEGENGKLSPPTGWWGTERFVSWLTDEQLTDQPKSAAGTATDWRGVRPSIGRRTRVAIDSSTRTASEGQLFSYDLLEPITWLEDGGYWNWSILTLVSFPDQLKLPAVATLGADRRLVFLEPVAGNPFAVPDRLLERFAQADRRWIRLVTVTPTVFPGGYLPVAGADPIVVTWGGVELELKAAAVSRPLPVSGWNMASQRPKPTWRAVPAGSVYFARRPDGAAFSAEEVRGLWLAQVGERTQEGFGYVVPGICTYEMEVSEGW